MYQLHLTNKFVHKVSPRDALVDEGASVSKDRNGTERGKHGQTFKWVKRGVGLYLPTLTWHENGGGVTREGVERVPHSPVFMCSALFMCE
jgi:hypothetical protein